jgi:8-oxo-dGTP diphosphatase
VPPTTVHRVVGALVVRDGLILLGHRTASRAVFPDVWDLAGGHIEVGESAAQAMVRECREELGIEIAQPTHSLDRWRDDTFDLTAFRVVDWTGEVSNCATEEHDRLAWFTPEATQQLDLAHERYRPLFAAEAGRGPTGP